MEPSARPTSLSVGTDDPVLAEIIGRLVDTYHPDRIYLFGSRARVDATPDSDYDVMVIIAGDAPPGLRRSAPGYRALWDLGTAVDVLVWTREAFDQRLHLQASLPSTVVREGRLVYRA